MVFDLLILFNDGTFKIVEEVSAYGFMFEGSIFWFDKNGYRSFLPKENINYFGREFDWGVRKLKGETK